MVGIHSTVEKRAKRMPDITVKTTEIFVQAWVSSVYGPNLKKCLGCEQKKLRARESLKTLSQSQKSKSIKSLRMGIKT